MKDESDDLMREAALTHLAMLFQVANGQATESPERTEKRYLALTQYLVSGTIAVRPEERENLTQLQAWLSTHLPKTEEAEAEPVAA